MFKYLFNILHYNIFVTPNSIALIQFSLKICVF